MTSSNRLLNRILLAVVGLAALAVAATAVWPAVTGSVLPVVVPDLDTTWALGVLTAAAVVTVVLCVAWIGTRGRGRTRAALHTGDVRIDTSAVEAIVKERLSASPDVAGVRLQGYRVRRQRMLLLTVQARRHPDLPRLRSDIAGAIDTVDTVLGTRLTAVAHVTTGVRTTLASSRTTH
jgi:hypothetical protein